MRKKSLVASAIVLASIFFLLGRLSAPVGSGPSRVEQDASIQSVVQAPSIPPAPLEVDYDTARKAISEESANEATIAESPTHDIDVNEALGILEKAIKDHPVSQPTDGAFGEKYKSATLGDLEMALTVLGKIEEKTRMRLINQKMDDGIYEVMREGEHSPEVKSEDCGTAIGSRTEMRNGEQVSLWTTISGDEYPEYRAIYSELSWVRNRVHLSLHPPEK